MSQSVDDLTPYGYVPTESIAIIFVALFAVSTLAHLGQLVYFRTWFIIPTVLFCGLLELVGWSARLWSSISPLASTPFTMQITATIIAPTPLVAANFIILGRIIRRLGPSYSRLSPKLYSIIFCGCDITSLVIQAVGGGMASTAADSGRDPTPGGNVMLAGIIFQLVTITVYVFCAAEFFIRYIKDAPLKRKSSLEVNGGWPGARGPTDKHLRIMSIALVFSTICLFIRSIYRTIELADGWTGRIITTQVYFNVLDGAMVILAIFTLNFAHPGWLLKNQTSDVVNEGKRGLREGTDTPAST
ncbi:RTA1-like protein [Infundibulicybe gibba]|nr:RTA1-like protein [Infundibulicybe gibba]